MNGDQRNFRLYGTVAKANKPIVVLETFKSTSQIPKVDKTKTIGSPDAIPNIKIRDRLK